MNKSYKHEILNSIIGSDVQVRGGVYGTPQANQTVKFQYGNTIAKGANDSTPGAISFTSGANGSGAVFISGTLVSSKVLSVDWASTVNAEHGEKTITVTYISLEEGHKGEEVTKTIPVIDEAALEAYFTGSKTIEYSDASVYEVKIKDNGGLAVDNSEGLYVNPSDFFVVDGSTIVQDSTSKKISTALGLEYVANAGGVPAHIALVNQSGAEIDSVAVSDIIGNGVVDHTSYNASNNVLSIFFKQADGTLNEVEVSLSELFDINDWAVQAPSVDFLSLDIDTSTATIGVKKADVTFTAADGDDPADLDVDTTNGEVLVASDAIPAIKAYVDAVASDNGISAHGDSYIDASVDSTDNKKINIEAQTVDLTVAKEGNADTTITGTSGKLVDAADAATKTSSFVNARIEEEIKKLGNTEDSSATFVKVEITTENGDVSVVTVTESVGSITGTASDLSGEEGLVSGDDVATAVKTYVDGQIDALDSSIDITSSDSSIAFDITLEDGKVTESHISYVKSTVTFTPADGATPADLTATAGFVTGEDIESIKSYVDEIAGGLDSSVQDSDSKSYVTVGTEQTNGALSTQTVEVVYGEVTATPGEVTIDTNGIVDAAVLKEAVEGALTWTVLD